MPKMAAFQNSECSKIDFTQKSEWQRNPLISTLCFVYISKTQLFVYLCLWHEHRLRVEEEIQRRQHDCNQPQNVEVWNVCHPNHDN